MPALPELDIARLLAVLQYLTILFFVAGSAPLLTGGKRRLRQLALVAYGCAVLLALAWVAIWLVQPPP